MKGKWKLGGRVGSTDEYLFYLLVELPGFGSLVMRTAFVPVKDFWSGQPLRVLQQTTSRTEVAA